MPGHRAFTTKESRVNVEGIGSQAKYQQFMIGKHECEIQECLITDYNIASLIYIPI